MAVGTFTPLATEQNKSTLPPWITRAPHWWERPSIGATATRAPGTAVDIPPSTKCRKTQPNRGTLPARRTRSLRWWERPHADPSARPGINGQCRLLMLPPELRNCIYELVVTRDTPISMRPNARSTNGKSKIYLQQPALAATCRQIQKEVLEIYYSRNIFEQIFDIGGWLNDGKSFAAYLDTMGPALCKCLTKVRMLFVFREHPNPGSILPWLRVFCRGSDCMPRPEALNLDYVIKPVDGHAWSHIDWLEGLMNDLTTLGWRMFGADQPFPNGQKSNRQVHIDAYVWLLSLGKEEYKGLIDELYYKTVPVVRGKRKRSDRRDRSGLVERF